jgi:hypothetical protein
MVGRRVSIKLERQSHEGHVYGLADIENGVFKIGYSDWVQERIRHFNRVTKRKRMGCWNLLPILVIPGTLGTESQIHSLLFDWNVNPKHIIDLYGYIDGISEWFYTNSSSLYILSSFVLKRTL